MSAKAKAKAEAKAKEEEAAAAAASGEAFDEGAEGKGEGLLAKAAAGKAGAEEDVSETRKALQQVGVFVSKEDDVLQHCSVAGTLASRPEMRDIHVTDFTASIFGRKL